MPREIVAAVEKQGLDTSHPTPASDRHCVATSPSGRVYPLVQRRVLLGDEMGLGKTIQAIAAMGHLAAHGAQSLRGRLPTRGTRRTGSRRCASTAVLEVHRIHGPVFDRERALRQWRDRGGVAVTSFGLAAKHEFDAVEPDLVVVDEAHFVKNPTTQRAAAVRRLVDASDRALFMTGTPLENKVEDFINLVTLLQPDALDQRLSDVDGRGRAEVPRGGRAGVLCAETPTTCCRSFRTSWRARSGSTSRSESSAPTWMRW